MGNIMARIDQLFSPLREELSAAQQQAVERIQRVMWDAEGEAADKSRFMTSEQRMQSAEVEMAKAEEHLLSALGSVYKALCYLAPQINPLSGSAQIKEVKGRVEDA